MIDPLAQIACRTPAANPDWWATDADTTTQTIAATLCMGCPALTACDQYRRQLGTDAAGTYAAHYQPLIDAETDAEFLEIAAALGWNDTPADLNMRDTPSGGWEQLTLWGPSVGAGTATSRRRRVRPGSGSAGGRGVAVPAHTAGA